jgi:hypothetical protein
MKEKTKIGQRKIRAKKRDDVIKEGGRRSCKNNIIKINK